MATKEYNAKYRIDNKEKIAKAKREAAAKLKQEVLSAYGLVCKHCGFDNVLALTIDHIDNDGKIERKEKGRHFSGEKFYRDLKQRAFPSGYQTLCFNCNVIKYRESIVQPEGSGIVTRQSRQG